MAAVRGPISAAAMSSALLCVAVLATPAATAWWALFLTVCQVVAMQGCSRDRGWGWAFGLTLQAPWAVYAVLTVQFPFLLTSVLCAVAQITALRRLAAARDAGGATRGIPNPCPLCPQSSPVNVKESR